MPVRALLATLMLLAVVSPGPAAGQTGPDLSDLVVDWATGRYASPVMCEIGGELVRGLRRVILRPHHTLGRPTRLAVHFIDMKPGEATRCIDSMGTPQPNVQGKLLLGMPGTPHPETATRDFKRALQRDKGFVLEVTEGVLKMQGVAVPPPSPRLVDYRGGEASLRLVLPATDAARELAPFPSPRKLLLSVESDRGTPLELPLFLASEDPV